MNENALNAKASKTPREYWFNVKKNWQLYLLLLPVALWFLIWAYKPMLGLIIAFKDYDAAYGMFGSDFVGFDNFVTLIAGGQSNQFWQAFRNTFIISAYGLLFGFPIPIILALFFNPERAHLWFMYAIIAIYIALPFISKMAKNLTKKEEDLFIILWLFFNGICYVLKLMIGTSITYQVPIISGTYYLGYFLIGHIIYKRYKNYKEKEKLKDYNKLLLLTFIASNAIILIVTLIMSEVTGTYYKKYFTYINIFTVLNSLAVFLYILINFKDLKPNISEFINKVAPYSLGIYLVHGIFLDILKEVINLNNISSLIAIPIFTIVLFIISYFVIKGLKQIPKIDYHILCLL